ncbi:hypothetical protein MYCTH_100400 [Thermothelomyces thermophilus ATCC 42464]|uniref:Uncharacterized protein n=1 Tax=Thermothelomyces thermophilus (strain ATCC 42464 / BCRC 31852 / DSM 1799) TaxID=573729 RepID=G2QAY5_THET4|nr:uncharacterized protein MYCTH_100400 [Thermothelomyces thermophilus ATCC 42464]AEO56777.1 hypothetical protein MYCTH_100400 [Thermothelomyces thermophilus ATCC 42464]
MFEVDWKDYDCERVGERRARKEIEREQKRKEGAKSGHQTDSTTSSRALGSKDQRHRNFFGSIGRSKTVIPSRSHKRESVTPEQQATKANGQLRGGSKRFSGSSMASSILRKGNAPARSVNNKLQNVEPSAILKGASNIAEPTSPDTPDRWMTQLTIPTPESRDDGSMAEAAGAIEVVQLLDRKGATVNEVAGAAYRHDKASYSSSYPETGVATNIAATPRTPKTPITPSLLRPKAHAPSPLENNNSASRLISNWFTALYAPNRPQTEPITNETNRRETVLSPPNVAHQMPQTPTRRSAKRTGVYRAPNPSPIRFSAENPNSWRAFGEWDRVGSSTAAQGPAPAGDGEGRPQDEEILRLMADDLRSIHFHEEEAVPEERTV